MLFRSPLSPLAYLSYQAVGSLWVNAAINLGLIWPARDQAAFAVFGPMGSVAFDTCLTSVLLTFFTVVSGTFFVRLDQKRGLAPVDRPSGEPRLRSWIAPSVLRRALGFTVFFGPLGALAGLGALGTYPSTVTFTEFAVFKVTFACLLGFVVTPLNALGVITRLGD
jgi:hypothetical protein